MFKLNYRIMIAVLITSIFALTFLEAFYPLSVAARRLVYNAFWRTEYAWVIWLLMFGIGPLFSWKSNDTAKDLEDLGHSLIMDRWTQFAQHVVHCVLLAPILLESIQPAFIVLVGLPLLTWVWLVLVPGQTNIREWRYHLIFIGITTLSSIAAFAATWSLGGPVVLSLGLFSFCVLRVVLAWRGVKRGILASPVQWSAAWGEIFRANLFLIGFFGILGAALFYGCSYYPTAGDTEEWQMEELANNLQGYPRIFERHAAIFLVADNQFHDLDGRQYEEQDAKIKALFAEAKRPELLDLLSEYTLSHLARAYERVATEFEQQAIRSARNQYGPIRMGWAHLGDFADISCRSEIERFDRVIEEFEFGPQRRLTALVPGNHDGFFIGNYRLAEEESWNEACSPVGVIESTTKRADRKYVHEKFGQLSERQRDAGAQGNSLGEEFLAWVWTPLGYVCDHRITAVFLDTSEEPGKPSFFGPHTFDIAPVGWRGHVSESQVEWIKKELSNSTEPSLVVIFAHHPFEDLTVTGQEFLLTLFESLGPRLLAYVAGHTHEARHRGIWTFSKRRLPEFIIGSTTDPPQEAAILEFGVMSDQTVGIRMKRVFSVVPSEANGSMLDELATAYKTSLCREILDQLANRPDCRALLQSKTSLITSEEDVRKQLQALDQCLLSSTPETSHKSVSELANRLRDASQDRPEVYKAGVCLSWIASVMHKYGDSTGAKTIAGMIELALEDKFLVEKLLHEEKARHIAGISTGLHCSGKFIPPEIPWYRSWQVRRDVYSTHP